MRCRDICSALALVLTASILPSGLVQAVAATAADTTEITPVLSGGAGDGGPAKDALVNAGSMDRDTEGNLWFYDYKTRTVRRIDTAGTVTSVWGNGKSTNASALISAPDATAIAIPPSSIWTTTSGDLYLVSDEVLSRIRPDGTFERLLTTTVNQFGPYSSTKNADQPIYVRSDGSVLLRRYRDAGNNVTTKSIVALPPGEPKSTNATTLIDGDVIGIDETADGTLYYAAGQSGAVDTTLRRLNADGSSTLVGGPGPNPAGDRAEGTPATDINMPLTDFAVSADGNRIVYAERAQGTESDEVLRTFTIGGSVTNIGGPAGTSSSDVLCSRPRLQVVTDGVLVSCSGSIRQYDFDGSTKSRGRLLYGVNQRSEPTNSPDGVPISRAFVRTVNQLAIDPRDGAVALATGDDIRKVTGDGADATLNRIVGGGSPADGLGDGGAARDAVARPVSFAFAPDGRLFTIAATTVGNANEWRLRVVGLDGVIRTVAGGGSTTGDLNGVNARSAQLQSGRVAVSPDGAFAFISQPLSGQGQVVYRVPVAGGDILRVAGGGSANPDGRAALATSLDQITGLQTGPDGALYMVSYRVLLRLDENGTLAPVDAVPADNIEVRLDGSRLSSMGTLWKRRPDGAYVVVVGSPLPAAAGMTPVGGKWTTSWIAGFDDGRIAFADTMTRATPAVAIATPADQNWTGGAPDLDLKSTPAGQYGTVDVTVDLPAADKPWLLCVRASKIRSPGDPTAASSAIEKFVTAEGGTSTVTISKLTDGYSANTYPSAQMKGGTTVYITVFAFSGNGEQAPVPLRGSAVVPDNLVPTSLTAGGSKVMPAGGSTSVSATLTETATGTPVSGESITLRKKPYTEDWSTVTTLTTDALGTVTYDVNPALRTEYRWSYAGSSERKAADSDPIAVDVKPELTVAAPTLVKAGGVIKFTGSTNPKFAPAPVRVEEQLASGWQTVAPAPLNVDGTFSASVPGTTTGDRRFRLVKDADNAYLGATSSVLTVRVYRAVVSSILYDPKGDDKKNLNGEYVVLKNTGVGPVDLGNWVLLAGKAKLSFKLPAYLLMPNQTVKIHTGKGTNGKGNLYLAAKKPLWNDKADSATVRDRNGTTAATFSYKKQKK